MDQNERISNLKGFSDVKAQFMRRAERREFPIVKYLVYLNSSVIIANDMDLMHDLMKYGLDILYSRLEWTDKVQILDIANRSDATYVQKAFNRVVIDIITSTY